MKQELAGSYPVIHPIIFQVVFIGNNNCVSNMTKEERRAYDRRWYAENKDRLKDQKNERVRNIRYRNSKFVHDYFKQHPCVDCGENDPVVLEFDHMRDKLKTISDMIRQSYSIEKIEKEMQKCEVRCANCHRRRTAKQFKWYKNGV